MTTFTLSASTQEAIQAALASPGADNINYLNAYNAIYSDIEANGNINTGTAQWFSMAGYVNTQAFKPNAAGTYIWNYTISAGAAEGATITTSDLQQASNTIALQVFQQLANSNYSFTAPAVNGQDTTDPFSIESIIATDAGAGITKMALLNFEWATRHGG